MGADFLLTMAEWPMTDDGEPRGYVEVRDALRAGIKDLRGTDLGWIAEEYADYYHDGDEPASEDDFLKWLDSQLDELIYDNEHGEGLTRGASLFGPLKGQWYVAAGLLSWGDVTEEYDAISRLVQAGVLSDGASNSITLRFA